MKICVTNEHIANGLGGSANECPVALALADSGFEPDPTLELLVSDNIFVMDKETCVDYGYYPYPDSVRQFIAEFDEMTHADSFDQVTSQPFEFELNREDYVPLDIRVELG